MGNVWVFSSNFRSIRNVSETHQKGKVWGIGYHNISIKWVVFSITFPSYVILHDMGNSWVFSSISRSTRKGSKIHQIGKMREINSRKNPTKPNVCEEPGKLVLIFSPTYGYFSSIRFPSFGILYHMENAWLLPSISNHGTHFSHSIGDFFPVGSHPIVYFIIYKMHDFPHQFPIAWKNAVKSIKFGEPGKLVPIFSPTYGYISSIRFQSFGILYHMENAWLFPSISNTTENAAKSTRWALRMFFHSITVSSCSKIWWFVKRTNRKN